MVLDPILASAGGRRLTQVLGWNDPDRLAQAHLADLREASYGYADFEIAERLDVDDFLPMVDGFAYSSETYLRSWRARRGFHQPDQVDYGSLLTRLGLVEKVNRDLIDEVWVIGPPFSGFYESRMAGPGAFWCNAPPLESAQAARRFVIMAYNYERGAGEMLESFGHRAESILAQVYRHASGPDNLWERFTRYDQSHPGRAEVGTIHFAPNSRRDYEWGSRLQVSSHSQAWLSFPDLSASPRLEDSRTWGDGDIHLHHLWWLRHLPHVAGETHGISNNWWEYILDPNRVS